MRSKSAHHQSSNAPVRSIKQFQNLNTIDMDDMQKIVIATTSYGSIIGRKDQTSINKQFTFQNKNQTPRGQSSNMIRPT